MFTDLHLLCFSHNTLAQFFSSLLFDNPKKGFDTLQQQAQTRIITTFSKQHRALRKILQKHWHILLIDQTLNQFIPKDPLITFKHTRSLRDKLVTSEYTGEFRGDPCRRLGTFTCGGCPKCQFMNIDKNVILPNGQRYRPSHFANCCTFGVVYLLTCPCGCFYVGKTKLELHMRMGRHINSMRTCNPDLPLDRHACDVHQGNFPRIKFLVLDRVHPNSSGGDWDKILLQKETRWIVALQATSPPGLNDCISYRPFLEGFTSGIWEGLG